jgi:hypothetical protein
VAAGGVCRPATWHQWEDQLSPSRTALSPPTIHLQDGRSGGESPRYEFGSTHFYQCPSSPCTIVERVFGVMTARVDRPLMGSIHTYPSLRNLLRKLYVTKNQSDIDKQNPTVLTIKKYWFIANGALNKFIKSTGEVCVRLVFGERYFWSIIAPLTRIVPGT